jgi:soluble lytic murein transglycosylase-like protein
VFLALRQDAISAADASPEVGYRLGIAMSLGVQANDWPLALHLLHRGPWRRFTQMQADPRFLATAYPAVFITEIRESARKREVKPELIYALTRQESLFNPSALSPRGALGLFQFTPSTFESLNRKWRLVESAGVRSRNAFLLSPELSIDLGARWLRDELLARERNNIPLAVMEHNAGRPAVKQWIERWERLGRGEDIEYKVDTIRFAETQSFTRRILADLVITEAIGLFDDSQRGAR